MGPLPGTWVAIPQICYIYQMPRKSAPKQDDPEQAKRFAAMARELGVDQRSGAFEKALGKVIPKPKKK